MNPSHQDLGRFVLRVTLGLLVLLHGIGKITGGIDPIVGMVQGAGLPGFLAYGAYVGEVVAPVLLIVGFQTRLAAILVAVNMLFAIGLAHRAELFTLNQGGGWSLELQGMFLFTAVALVLMGPGRYSINQR